ncbi:MAG TPA: DUF2341 domain-containing protein, partial [Candidatus Woesebacteria bacterium]|nr:DUF2341 domain-containing protein [Candidatus Woesebacteria bacterium]
MKTIKQWSNGTIISKIFFKPHLNFRTWLFFVLSLFIIGIGVYFLQQTKEAKAAWFDDSYSYRQRIPISNGGSAQTDFQVGITLNTSALISAGKMQSDCDDIRFTAENGEVLPYWIEENNPGCNNTSTRIWIQIPSIPTSDTNIYMYYGNISAQKYSDGSSVFPFFDDFNDSSLNGRWASSGGSIGVSSGELSVNTGAVYTPSPVVTSAQNYIYETRVKWTTTSGSYSGLQIAEVPNPQSSNNGSHALVYFMTSNTANYTVTSYASDGSATGYGITSGITQFTATANTYSVIGYSSDSSNIRYYNNRTQTTAYSGTWTEAPYMSLGTYTGSAAGTTNGKDMVVDWVLARKYVATMPTIGSFGSEEISPAPVVYWKFDEGQGLKVQNSQTIIEGKTTNFVLNPSFENGTTNWTVVNGGTWSSVQTGCFFGSSCAKGITTNTSQSLVTSITGLAVGSTVTASVHMRAESASVNFY